MKIILDENLDWRLERYLPGHEVASVPRIGWAGMKNGLLLKSSSQQFDVLVTMDSGIPHQNNLTNLDIAVIGLQAPSNRLADTAPLMEEVLRKLPQIQPGTITIISADDHQRSQ